MIVLLTGGSRGIGKGIKEIFENQNHTVISPSKLEMDLSDIESVKSYLNTIKDIDIIINNAGVNYLNTIENETTENLNKTLNINYLSPFTICQYFLPLLKNKNYGRIINIGSIWIDYAKSFRGSYSASKNALHSLTKTIVSEYSEYNILCNTISPGYILTDLTLQNNTKEDLDIIKTQIPQKRLGTIDEISKLVYFLTIENTYINGQNIIIDGGYSCTSKS
jgi:3-oxoacyl-[acyl-carrier protein] reductase